MPSQTEIARDLCTDAEEAFRASAREVERVASEIVAEKEAIASLHSSRLTANQSENPGAILAEEDRRRQRLRDLEKARNDEAARAESLAVEMRSAQHALNQQVAADERARLEEELLRAQQRMATAKAAFAEAVREVNAAALARSRFINRQHMNGKGGN